MPPIQDHPLRYKLANELHARPFPVMGSPSTVAYLAVKQPSEAVYRDKDADRQHLIGLLDRHGAPHPQPGATHHSAQIGRHMLKWEQHTEFVSYTVFSEGVSARAFDPADFAVFPEDWLEQAPGERITSLLMRLEERPEEERLERSLSNWFVPESMAASAVLDGSAVIASDFRIDPAGQVRFAVFVSPGTGERRIGRIVQRLCEVETYKAMSMLGYARARKLNADLGGPDAKLSRMMAQMTGGEAPAEETLTQLLTISAQLEAMGAESSFRFGATGAYEALVNQRIGLLREERLGAHQTFGDFMMRRYEPAMRTVKSAETRLVSLADRARRAGELLRTRVDVERSAMSQAVLESMDRRADLQLRLQHTVEGLSVVAISYYAVSLTGYVLYPLAQAFDLSKGNLVAVITVPVVAAVWMGVRRIRKKLH